MLCNLLKMEICSLDTCFFVRQKAFVRSFGHLGVIIWEHATKLEDNL